MTKPDLKPNNPCFSSGPTAKRPGWSLTQLQTNSLGRSHRAKGPKSRLTAVIAHSKQILQVPDDYVIGIVPASDTGAFEMAMWTLLGARGVDVLHWESFGSFAKILGEVWEVRELDLLFLAVFGSSGSWTCLWELWELSESSGRGLGGLGAGFVAPGGVWELWKLDLSCLAKFGSSWGGRMSDQLMGG